MSQAGKRHAIIERLRDEIRRMEHRAARRDGAVLSGVASVDALLPGGFPRGALTELTGGPASGKTAVALAVFAALGPEDLAAYVDGRGEIYPPAAVALGVDLDRLLVVRTAAATSCGGEGARPPGMLPTLWAAEALLSSGAFAAVAIDVLLPRSLPAGAAIGRRLQAAVERGGAIGLWLTQTRGGFRVPAAIRLEISTHGGEIAARRADGTVRPRGAGARSAGGSGAA